jgi:acetyl esterase
MTLRSDPAPKLRPVERILHRVLRAACALPAPVQELLGGGPVVRDGETLEPELLLLRRIAERVERPRPSSPVVFRKQQGAGARMAGGPRRRGVSTRRIDIPGPAGLLRARLYTRRDRPASRAATASVASPLLVFLHGGGFVFGDVDSHDAPCRLLCRHADAHVLSVEYRLAPESPFPAAVDDARAALAWAFEHAAELGCDPSRIAIGGDSAGGNLAAVVSQVAAADGGPAPIAQLLIYPATDRKSSWRSVDLFSTGFFLTRESIDWFYAQYVPEAKRLSNDRDPRVDPLLATDLRGLPPALVVTAGFDPLRDEGEAYAGALAAAGNQVTLRRFGGLMHGFINLVGLSRACRGATVEMAHVFRTFLHASTVRP